MTKKSNDYLANVSFLLVEPNLFMRSMLKNVLAVFGCKDFDEVETSGEAFSHFQSKAIDIVVTEYALSEGDGLTLIRRLRGEVQSRNQFVPVIMLTGYADVERIIKARDAGVTEFIAKPISAKVLMRHIAEVIENPRPFVKVENYFGPDRRRRRQGGAPGEERRAGSATDGNKPQKKKSALTQYEIDRLIAGQEIRQRVELSDEAREAAAVASKRRAAEIQRQKEIMGPRAKKAGY